MASKKGIRAWVTEEVYNDFAKVCEGSHLEPTKAAALIISKYSQLKDGMILDAIMSINPNLFRNEFRSKMLHR